MIYKIKRFIRNIRWNINDIQIKKNIKRLNKINEDLNIIMLSNDIKKKDVNM
ncbi:hypothetical protein Clo1100_3723 [Clostridium sp. BNL1100]|nr:hypothetical protein Clo1100_3723 [Clostridium sp. BNL1100]